MLSLAGGSTVFKFKPTDLFTETLDCAPSSSCIGQQLIDRQSKPGSLSECKIRKKQIKTVDRSYRHEMLEKILVERIRLFYYEGIFHMHQI